ncbi:P22AR C-terminal domain-containing protein [Mannheimia granulomatis]|uniref:P22AR C-terminal domain-containing protein n=1 Tax=Mannheimia granulomatis TaxID=85402 RepID=UPI00067D16D4|nr:P22AR C-terminal domain-containing protein [Mannheimia granulomatis]QLB18702.1 bacteriocin [Mannheimia granulomatis]
MSNLQILSNSIRQIDNLYSLTDLHKASGGNEKHKPVLFLRLDQTKDLISEIENDKVQICTLAVKTVRGGTNPSTYACKELVIAYAAWISPQFHLVVLRAFLDKLENSQNSQQNLPLALPEKKYQREFTKSELEDIAWCWFEANQMCEFIGNLKPALQVLGSNLYPQAYSMHHEYGMHLKRIGKLIHRITQGIEFESRPFQKLNESFTLKAELATS